MNRGKGRRAEDISLSEHRLGTSTEASRLGAWSADETLRRRNIVARNTLSAVLVLLFLCSAPASADILIDKPQAQVGDLVHIKIVPALQDQTLVIITPSTTYRFIGGMPDNAAFVPEQPGQHIIRVIDQNTLVDTASFMVQDGAGAAQERATASRLQVSAQEVTLGEPIIIDAPVLSVQAIGVRGSGVDMRYVDSHRPVTYIPRSSGPLEIWLRYANGSLESTTVQVHGSTDPYAVAPADPGNRSFELSAPMTQPAVETSAGGTVDADMIWRRQGMVVRQTSTALFGERDMDPGVYDLELQMRGRSLRSIILSNFSYRPGMRLGVEEVTEPRGAPARTISAFAIDPTMIEFAVAEVSFIADGIALHKCIDYNFTTQTCYGENVRIMDLVPGQEYTITIDSKDPLFSQTGYLVNRNFDTDISGWTTFNAGARAGTFSWVAADGTQSGIAQITASGKSQYVTAGYYQQWNLTIPQGTVLQGINFSGIWRIAAYASPGSVNLTIENTARTVTYCSLNRTFAAVTAYAHETLSTGTPGCSLSSFVPNTNYTFTLYCSLNTPGGQGGTETCRWDNASITAWYNDTTAPVLRNAAENPDPVDYGEPINISVNVTDNVAVDTVLVQILGTNHTMAHLGGGIYSFTGFSTARAPGVYTYAISANDTNGNTAWNTSGALNFTIRDARGPDIAIISPPDGSFTAFPGFNATYNLSDQVGVSQCSLIVDGTTTNTTATTPLGVTLELSAALGIQGPHLWNITCSDTSGNQNTSAARTITYDSIPPQVTLDTPDLKHTNAALGFRYIPLDANLGSCALWTNLTGAWAVTETNSSPASGAQNGFTPVLPADGAYRWNVWCNDSAGNHAFSDANRTAIFDTVAPNSSGANASPASGAVYAPGASYTFNITWTDRGAGINTTVLETNFNGAPQNVTAQRTGDTFTYTFTNLAAGTYTYRWHANDTAGNSNSSRPYTYIVAKASPILNLTLNGSHANMSVGQHDYVNSTGWLLTPSSGTLQISLDNQIAASGENYVTHTAQLTEERRYNFTLIYPATQNYTEGRLTLFADVVDKTPPTILLADPPEGSLQPSIAVFRFTPYDNVDVENCTVILDGILNATKDVGAGAQANITISGIADGPHTWAINCTDTSNNSAVNGTLTFSADTAPPEAFNLRTPASGTISYDLSPTFRWNQTSDENFAKYIFEMDNDVTFSSVYTSVNASPVTNTSITLAIPDQYQWHWRVIAYDLAGNSRISDDRFMYTADAIAPIISQTLPANSTYINSTWVTLNYTVNDFTGLQQCSLYIDGALNDTDTSISQGMNGFGAAWGEDTLVWSVTCTDAAGNVGWSENRTITLDITSPAAFNTSGPEDGTITSDSTPEYSWEESSDPNFANYTVQVSDDSNFSHINYTFAITSASVTWVNQTPGLSDGTWYWRVVAYDLAGNSYIAHPAITVDTTPPSAFNLLNPADGIEERNTTKLFAWEQTQDPNFANYTLIISDSPSFAYINRTNSSLSRTSPSAWLSLQQDVIWHWRVIAYDLAGNSRNSTQDRTFIPDFASPAVQQVSPNDGALITSNPLIPFRYNVTDIGTVQNCSLYVNDTLQKTVFSVERSTTLTFMHTLQNGFFNWSVSCADLAGNIGRSGTRNITVAIIVPTQRLYESTPGAPALAVPATVNLSAANDSTQGSASASISSDTVQAIANAVYRNRGKGMLLFNGTILNFSGRFSADRANEFYITWRALKTNGSGITVLCQSGDNGLAGTLITATGVATYRSNCTYVGGDNRFYAGDNLTMEVNVFKSGTPARGVTHYWEGASYDSFMQFPAYMLGTLSVNFTNRTDPLPNETTSFTMQCNATCSEGTCLNTEVSLELWDGTAWRNVTNSGNITLNGTQVNPVSLGNINSTTLVNFSVYGVVHSRNNTLRCTGTSTYSDATSLMMNISVIDRTPPAVALGSPPDMAAMEPQSITFTYNVSDLRLSSCQLWGNFSGTWKANQTDSSPSTSDSWEPVFLDYGHYSWNVRCDDTEGNAAFAPENSTLIIAGDLSITGNSIWFSPVNPIEGQNTTVYANVTNNARKAETGVVVQFWLGDPSTGSLIGSRTVDVSASSNKTVNESLIASVGTSQVYMLIDPPEGSGSVIESDEGNNLANRTLFVSGWQSYYGEFRSNVTLGAGGNATMASWEMMDHSGNLYIADTDSQNGISFGFLRALGRNTTGQVNGDTSDDFEELDRIIGIAGNADSVNKTFTASGMPSSTRTFSIYGNTLYNVPYVNSDPEDDFVTGILWDIDDSSDASYDEIDREDIVFVTEIKNSTYSIYGMVDYNIKVPSGLKQYRGSANTVNFYYELY